MFGALLVAIATGLATTVGAVPFLIVPAVSRRFYDTLLGLGAGLMLAAATLGLLATALEDLRPHGALDPLRLMLVLCGFSVGVALLYLMDRLIPHEHAGGHHVHVHEDHVHHDQDPGHEHPVHRDPPRPSAGVEAARKQGLLVVGVMALHRLPEGFAIGAAWAAGGQALGLTLAVAVAVQNGVEGAVMAAPLRRGGLNGPSLLGLVTLTGLAIPVAAVAGYHLSSSVPGALPPMLALAGGALLYLTCNEVIPESHSHGNEVRATFGLLAGFVFIMVIRSVFGHAH
ncbi:MAG: ZIP family metal transporter [Myxococcales bacterium]|nr:ZIP family metal transporter [Myxococcales bacterium]